MASEVKLESIKLARDLSLSIASHTLVTIDDRDLIVDLLLSSNDFNRHIAVQALIKLNVISRNEFYNLVLSSSVFIRLLIHQVLFNEQNTIVRSEIISFLAIITQTKYLQPDVIEILIQ